MSENSDSMASQRTASRIVATEDLAISDFATDIWGESARSKWRPLGALAAASCAVLALAGAMHLWWSWDFQYSNPYDIRGWVWAHRYPKQQEVAAYVLAVVAVVAGAFAGRTVWCAIAAALNVLGAAPTAALRLSAIALIAAAAASPLLAGPAWTAVAPLWLPLVVALALALASGIPDTPPQRRPAASSSRTILVGLVAPLAIYAYFYNGQTIVGLLNLFEDGNMLAPLQESLRGGTVYRDSYLQHGLFHNLGKPLLASTIEVSLTSFRAVDAFFKPFAYIAFFTLGVAVFRSSWTALAATLSFASPNLQISDRQSLGLLSVALIAFALRREAEGDPSPARLRAYYAASGAGTVLAFFYSTEIGIYTAAACGGFVVARALLQRRASAGERDGSRIGPAVAYGLGAALTALPFLAYFTWHGVLLDFAANTYMQCTYQAAAWGLPFDSLARATARWPELTRFAGTRPFRAYLAPAVYLGAVGVVGFRLARPGFWQSRSSQTLLLITLAALAWFRTALGRFDPYHLGEGTPFLCLLVFLNAEHVLASLRRALSRSSNAEHAPTSVRALVLTTGIALLAADSWVLQRAYKLPSTIIARAGKVVRGELLGPSLAAATDRLGPIEQPAEMADNVRAVVRRIRALTDRDDFIFDFTNQGSLYFLADRRSPWRYQQVVYSATPAMDRALIDDLEAARPSLVVMSASGPIATYLSKIDGVSTATRHPQVVDYLAAHYRFTERVGGTDLYLRADLAHPVSDAKHAAEPN